MTANEYREWAAQNNASHGSMTPIDCGSVADAEHYAADFPADSHGFATCGNVKVPYTTKEDTVLRLRQMMSEAGFLFSKEESLWRKDGFRARVAYNDAMKTASIFIHIHSDGSLAAYATGPGGYLHPADRPEV
jgi:hypothetical protein